jgi:hypothetical protein
MDMEKKFGTSELVGAVIASLSSGWSAGMLTVGIAQYLKESKKKQLNNSKSFIGFEGGGEGLFSGLGGFFL